MKVLVTGSAGFLGRHAVRTFEALGHQVTGVDITAGIDCRYVYDSAEYFDIVLHFAAIVGGRATIDGNPLAVAQTIALDVALFNHTQRVQAAACGLPVIIGGVPHPTPAAPSPCAST